MPTTRVFRDESAAVEAEAHPSGPEPTFLQIQGVGDPTTRMIELPAGPARVGRGAHCEVRLADPGLGEVQCLLRRRGATWHFQPVGPAGQVWFDGRAVDQQRPIPLGVPFRVGMSWLVLRPLDSATNDWGSFDDPITVEAEATVEVEAEAAPAEPPRASPPPPPGDGANEERLRRWEARLEQRERWLKDRQEERRWEARWKSAGETIRARSTPPAARPSAPPRASAPRPTPTPAPAPAPSMPTRPHQAPPVARIIEPKGPRPIRRVGDPAPRPSPPRVVVRPALDPSTPIRRPEAPAPARVMPRPIEAPPVAPRPPEAPTSRALVLLAPTPAPVEVEVEAQDVEPATSIEPAVMIEALAVEVVRPIEAEAEVVETSPLVEDDRLAEPPASRGRGTDPGHPRESGSRLEEAQPSLGMEEPGPGSQPNEFAETRRVAGVGTPPPEADDLAEPVASRGRGTDPGHPRESGPRARLREAFPASIEAARPVEVARPAVGPAGSPSPARAEWPSARSIFEAQGRRARPEPMAAAAKPGRRKATGSEPTEALGPACWSMPLWLGWFPTLVAVLAVGLGGGALACSWAVESVNANLAIRLATRPEGAPGPAIDPTLIPRGGWWASTAPHLAAWATALIRSGDGEDHSEDIRAMLEASRGASSLASRTRFAVDLPEATGPGSPPDLSHLGRTRDVVTLVWTGRRLAGQGKADAALRAYRSALEIASKANPADLDPPWFDEDPQVRRYALPREALLGCVVRAMAEGGEWTPERWAEVLPPSAAASMAASRVFAALRKPAEADRLADLAIRQAEGPTPPGFDPAEDLAAGAEALACRGRWPESAARYRLAIDEAADDATRRAWWLNLAEVAQRMQDDAGRARAIEAAKSATSVDEVTRRALRYQQGAPGLASTAPRP